MLCTGIYILTIHVIGYGPSDKWHCNYNNTHIPVKQYLCRRNIFKIRFRFVFLNTQFTPRHNVLNQASGLLQNTKSYIVDFKYRRITHKPLFNQTISHHLSR